MTEQTDGSSPQPDSQPAGTQATGNPAPEPTPDQTPPTPEPAEREALEKRLDRLESKLDKLLDAGAPPAHIAQTQEQIEATQAILETPASGEAELEKATTQTGQASDPERSGDQTDASSHVASGEPKGTKRAKSRAFGKRRRDANA